MECDVIVDARVGSELDKVLRFLFEPSLLHLFDQRTVSATQVISEKVSR